MFNITLFQPNQIISADSLDLGSDYLLVFNTSTSPAGAQVTQYTSSGVGFTSSFSSFTQVKTVINDGTNFYVIGNSGSIYHAPVSGYAGTWTEITTFPETTTGFQYIGSNGSGLIVVYCPDNDQFFGYNGSTWSYGPSSVTYSPGVERNFAFAGTNDRYTFDGTNWNSFNYTSGIGTGGWNVTSLPTSGRRYVFKSGNANVENLNNWTSVVNDANVTTNSEIIQGPNHGFVTSPGSMNYMYVSDSNYNNFITGTIPTTYYGGGTISGETVANFTFHNQEFYWVSTAGKVFGMLAEPNRSSTQVLVQDLSFETSTTHKIICSTEIRR